MRESEAVTLFTARALAAKRDFIANGEVRQICARLDNLPLAIELAAARVKVLSLSALLARLEQRLPMLAGGTRDAPERQRTLRATIEWSHDLLSTHEQRLFSRLAVFRGGWTLESAEQIVEADLDTLQSLVDKSLVRRRDDRYWMLETIREYAAERLDASAEAGALRGRHTEHFVALAEEAEPHLRGSPKKWADRLEDEHDNIRSALDTLEASSETQVALRLAGALAPFWYLRTYATEGRRRLEGILLRDQRGTIARAKALVGYAVMAFAEADLESAASYAEGALVLYRELGARRGSAYSARVLGNALGEMQTEAGSARAQKLLEESVGGFREVGDVDSELRAAYNLAVVLGDLGERDRERSMLEDILRRARALGLERDQSMALGGLSGFARREGRTQEAVVQLAECVRIERDLGDLAWTANNLARLAEALAAGGKLASAARLLGGAEALREKVALKWPVWASDMNDQTRSAIRAELDDTEFGQAFDEGRQFTIDDALALALDSVAGQAGRAT
jgi:tetratricopeptide (TPR) repeat protein